MRDMNYALRDEEQKKLLAYYHDHMEVIRVHTVKLFNEIEAVHQKTNTLIMKELCQEITTQFASLLPKLIQTNYTKWADSEYSLVNTVKRVDKENTTAISIARHMQNYKLEQTKVMFEKLQRQLKFTSSEANIQSSNFESIKISFKKYFNSLIEVQASAKSVAQSRKQQNALYEYMYRVINNTIKSISQFLPDVLEQTEKIEEFTFEALKKQYNEVMNSLKQYMNNSVNVASADVREAEKIAMR